MNGKPFVIVDYCLLGFGCTMSISLIVKDIEAARVFGSVVFLVFFCSIFVLHNYYPTASKVAMLMLILGALIGQL
jgi:hypothetical protein